jgi:hypothetical protein
MPPTTYGAFITSFMSGAFSGMLSAVVTTPIDLVKTRVQTSLHMPSSNKKYVAKKPPTARDIVMLIYKEEGLKGFMRGWVPRASKVFFAIFFVPCPLSSSPSFLLVLFF